MALTHPLAAMVFKRPLAIASALLLPLIPVSAAQDANAVSWQSANPPGTVVSLPTEHGVTGSVDLAYQSSFLFLEVIYGLPLRNADGQFSATAPLYRGQFASWTRRYIDSLIQRQTQGWQPHEQQCAAYDRQIQDATERLKQLDAQAQAVFAVFDAYYDVPVDSSLQSKGELLTKGEGLQDASAQSLTQARDVEETDSYFRPLQEITQIWGIDLLYDDQTFRGENALTQGEWTRSLTTFALILEGENFFGDPSNLESIRATIDPLLVTVEEQLEVATAALQELTDQMDAEISNLPKATLSSPSTAHSLLTAGIYSIEQVLDVSEADPYFEDLQRLIENYGLELTLEDDTFRGNTVLTRGDFVIYLEQMIGMIAGGPLHINCFGMWGGEIDLQQAHMALDQLTREIRNRQHILTADTP